MNDPDRIAKLLDTAVHELAQHLHVIEMGLAAIERSDGARHAKAIEPSRRALAGLERGVEGLAALAEEIRSGSV